LARTYISFFLPFKENKLHKGKGLAITLKKNFLHNFPFSEPFKVLINEEHYFSIYNLLSFLFKIKIRG